MGDLMDTDIVSHPESKPHVAAHGGAKQANMRKRLQLCIAVAVAVVVVGVWSWCLFGRNTAFNENKAINTGAYQAIFLTNGQVYFGKLADLNNKYVTIHDIYYLQVQQSQSTDKQLQNASGSSDTGAQVSLAKLGSELHGPQDVMHISSSQVLFWENLKSDSKVTQAIKAYQAK